MLTYCVRCVGLLGSPQRQQSSETIAPWTLGRLMFEDTSFRAYQDISDDSPPTMSSMIGSFMSSLRPDRAFSSTPVNTPKELFKDQYVVPYFYLLLDAEEHGGLSRPVSFSCRYLSLSCATEHFLQSSWKA